MNLQNDILKLCGESFDEGARASLTSLIESLEAIYYLNPSLTFAEVLSIIKTLSEKSEILKSKLNSSNPVL